LELWASALREVKARMRPLFLQERMARSARLFLDGLLGPERRKTGWMCAEAAGDPGPWRQQSVLGARARAVGCRCVARRGARLRVWRPWHAALAGYPCMATVVQGTVCKILASHEVKPHKVRYYLQRRDDVFEAKMADVLCVYREVAVLRESHEAESNVAIIILWSGVQMPPLPPRLQ
jgi:hypothetical protein